MINDNAMIKKPSNNDGSDIRPKSFISKYFIKSKSQIQLIFKLSGPVDIFCIEVLFCCGLFSHIASLSLPLSLSFTHPLSHTHSPSSISSMSLSSGTTSLKPFNRDENTEAKTLKLRDMQLIEKSLPLAGVEPKLKQSSSVYCCCKQCQMP